MILNYFHLSLLFTGFSLFNKVLSRTLLRESLQLEAMNFNLVSSFSFIQHILLYLLDHFVIKLFPLSDISSALHAEFILGFFNLVKFNKISSRLF
jgi:hypothetical protein